MRGSRPQPTRLKVLRGNPGQRRLPQHEAKVKTALPSPPPELGEVARREWYRIGRLMRSVGLISKFDRSMMAVHCATWERYLEALVKTRELGLVIKPRGSGLPHLNPWLKIVQDAAAELRYQAVEFGLTPSARTRIHATTPEDAAPKSKWAGLVK